MKNKRLSSNTVFQRLFIAQFFIAVFIYCSLLLAPNPGGTLAISFNDLFLHMLGNTILVTSTWLAFHKHSDIAGPVIFVALFSSLMELAQGFTDSRTPDIRDIAANLGGAVLGYVLCFILDQMNKQYRYL